MTVFSAIPYKNLSKDDLYDIFRLRMIVFIVGQNCAYQDIDDIDQSCIHILGRSNGILSAYARIIPPDADNFTSIGRVIVREDYRGQGLGKKLMEYSISQCEKFFPDSLIQIKAQNYLEKFYADLRFESTGNYFLEDGIPHQEMIYKG